MAPKASNMDNFIKEQLNGLKKETAYFNNKMINQINTINYRIQRGTASQKDLDNLETIREDIRTELGNLRKDSKEWDNIVKNQWNALNARQQSDVKTIRTTLNTFMKDLANALRVLQGEKKPERKKLFGLF